MARIRVKMCGFVRPEDVREAVRLGVEYLGFVFAPGSPRTLAPERAEELFRKADTGDAVRVGVFRDQPAALVNEFVRRFRLDLVQLHGDEPRDFPATIRVPVLRAVRVRALAAAEIEPQDTALAEPDPLAPNVIAVLLDAADATGRSGGLGLVPDPEALAAARRALPDDARIFLSGGLTAENVAVRVREFRPWAVDVSSGIERTPGAKDRGRMAAFVAALEGSA
jgi:phosphoribosylanthranilate isomerase